MPEDREQDISDALVSFWQTSGKTKLSKIIREIYLKNTLLLKMPTPHCL